MRIIIESGMFAAPNAKSMKMMSIWNLGCDRRHRVQVEDEKASAFCMWLDALPEEMREECRLALEVGMEEDARLPSACEVRIGAIARSDWQAMPPRLTLEDAYLLLHKPFAIVVEDGDHDRAFFLSMATPEQRRAIEHLEQRQCLEFKHGGGLKNIEKLIDKQVSSDAALLYFVLFDSDALTPGAPSPASEQVRTLCEAAGLRHHQLRRRAAENYLPKAVLHRLVYSNPGRKRTHEETWKAFATLRDEQRFHYNMRRGFAGDRTNATARADELYADLAPTVRGALEHGFSSQITKLFTEGSITGEELRKMEDGMSSTRGFVRSSP